MPAAPNAPSARNVWASQEQPELCLRVVEYPANFRQPLHVHSYASVTLVVRGTLVEESASYVGRVTPLSVVIKSPGVPHADMFGPNGCLTLQVRLPAELVGDLLGLLPARLHENGGRAVGALLSLLDRIKNLSLPNAADRTEDELYRALALLRRPAPSTNATPARISRVKEFIDSTLPWRCPTLKQLGAVAGVHPVHLTRQFKQTYGSSIRAYMKRRRLQAAIGAVESDPTSLTEIAYRFGYADQSHFCRDFKRFADLSPRRYRLVLRAFSEPGELKSFKL